MILRTIGVAINPKIINPINIMQHMRLIMIFIPFWKIYAFIFVILSLLKLSLCNLWLQSHSLKCYLSFILVDVLIDLLISSVLNSQKLRFIIVLFLLPLIGCPDEHITNAY